MNTNGICLKSPRFDGEVSDRQGPVSDCQTFYPYMMTENDTVAECLQWLGPRRDKNPSPMDGGRIVIQYR